MTHPGFMVDLLPMLEYRGCLARMTLHRCRELQPTVLVLRVVPATEGQYPLPGVLDGREAVRRLFRPLFAGPEQRFCVGIVITHPWTTEGGCHTQPA